MWQFPAEYCNCLMAEQENSRQFDCPVCWMIGDYEEEDWVGEEREDE